MGLITKEVEVNLSSKNIEHYKILKYNIPKNIKNKNGKIIKGIKIKVKCYDLLGGVGIKVEYFCDNCTRKFSTNWGSIVHRKNNDNNIYCRNCSLIIFGSEKANKTKIKNGLSFGQWCIDKIHEEYLKLWDYVLNKDDKGKEISPFDVTFGSGKKFYFLCRRGIHESEKKDVHVLTGSNGNLTCSKCESVGFYYPDVEYIWSDKNKKSPLECSHTNGFKVWWKCENEIHEDYKREVNNSIVCGFRCPKCTKERRESFLQEKVRLYLKSLKVFLVNHERDCSLICQNPNINNKHGWLLYDNEVVANNFNLIIEVHGKQHYQIMGFHLLASKKNGTTSEQEFEYGKWKDEFKKQFALNNGYHYLEIPYWFDDDNETWKYKINEMLNNIS